MKAPPFLMWYDDSRNTTLVDKVRDASTAYEARFGVAPTLVLVSIHEIEPAPDGARSVQTVQRNTVWVGQETS